MIRAFFLGLWECRSDCTTYFDWPLIEIYDRGRAIGRRLLLIAD